MTKKKPYDHTYTCSSDYTLGAPRYATLESHAQANYIRSGECAEHFGKVLAKYPPQVSSRSAAAMWGCFVHNIVNKRLKKPEFNCEDIGDAYDCGCREEDAKDKGKDETRPA
jgi:hypothetical protein